MVRTRPDPTIARHSAKRHNNLRVGGGPKDPDRRRRQAMALQMLHRVAPGQALRMLRDVPDVIWWVTHGRLMPEKLEVTLKAAGRAKS